MPQNPKLNIIDEQGNIIGSETRADIHKNGLLHREIHVWFYTPKGEIIFQHRAKNKDTYPDLLDATVGGHVEIGDDYLVTALREVEEETGVKTTKNTLTFIKMMRSKTHDPATGATNNVIRAVYAFRYDGQIEDLKIEEDEGIGFEPWPLEKLLNITDADRKRFIPAMLEKETLATFREIQRLV